MAEKNVTYKEPAGYFNAAMKKAARDWDKAHKSDKPKSGDKKKK